MPGIHDQALEWAQKNPNDPRAQDVMAKAWAASNPNDPRSAQIMAKFKQPVQDTSLFALGKGVPEEPPASAINAPSGQAAINALPAVGGTVGSFAGGFPGAVAGAGAGSALQAFLNQKPVLSKDTAIKTLEYGALPEVGGAALGLLGKGASKLGDIAMQKAVGLKYAPGVGTKLADEGLVGTKGMMQRQVEKRLAEPSPEIPITSDQPLDVETYKNIMASAERSATPELEAAKEGLASKPGFLDDLKSKMLSTGLAGMMLGPKAAATGYALQAPLAQSIGGQLATKGGQLASKPAAQEALKQLLRGGGTALDKALEEP